MANPLIILSILASFFITLFVTPIWIKKAKQIGLIWPDMNKYKKEKVAGSGGLIAVIGFVIGVLIYVAFIIFYLQSTNSHLVEILALLVVVLLLAGIGLVDDLLGWQRGGLSRRSRMLLTAIAAIPLMAINAGQDVIGLPFLGQTNLGILYPLFLIPIGIVGAATTFNILAGYNGLEAGQGVIILSAISIVSFYTGNAWLSIISLCMVFSLLAFLIFNFYPAKVFPGDSITYVIGGLIAIFSILGNFEKIAVFFFIPYILETILKSRGKLVKQSFGKPTKSGSLDLPYKKIYGLEHLSIYLMKRYNIIPTERKVILSLWAFQLVIVVLGFIIFRNGIF
jgi:UDP-N-acetylglucosamine--dolichyl-phosphate N-acetylglucosaminephosphotransferase